MTRSLPIKMFVSRPVWTTSMILWNIDLSVVVVSQAGWNVPLFQIFYCSSDSETCSEASTLQQTCHVICQSHRSKNKTHCSSLRWAWNTQKLVCRLSRRWVMESNPGWKLVTLTPPFNWPMYTLLHMLPEQQSEVLPHWTAQVAVSSLRGIDAARTANWMARTMEKRIFCEMWFRISKINLTWEGKMTTTCCMLSVICRTVLPSNRFFFGSLFIVRWGRAL
jgi:hypothetical protein